MSPESNSKHKVRLLILLSILLGFVLGVTLAGPAQPDDIPGIAGPYLGQEPPGTEPRVFAPGIISTPGLIEGESTWSPDLKEFYFARSETMESEWTANFSIWFTREVNGVWTEPEIASFSGVYRDFYPSISGDGSHMIFYRMSNAKNKAQRGSWITKREGDGWGEPSFFIDAYCLNTNDFRTFYFTTENSDTSGRDLAVFTYSNGEISGITTLEGELNATDYEGHGVISPDGDYLLFNRDNRSTFVSFRQQDGAWGPALDLDAEYFLPSISPDGKYIFFSKERDIYWVSTDIIENTRANNPSGND